MPSDDVEMLKIELDMVKLERDVTDASMKQLVALLGQLAEHLGRMGEVVGLIRTGGLDGFEESVDEILAGNYELRNTLESMVKDLTKAQ